MSLGLGYSMGVTDGDFENFGMDGCLLNDLMALFFPLRLPPLMRPCYFWVGLGKSREC